MTGGRWPISFQVKMNEIAMAENVIGLTPAAAGELRSLQEKPENTGKFMRFYVEKGGCSGMQYGMVFDEKRDGDSISGQHGVKILVDAISADYLRGTVVDFSEEMMGGGFKLSNPNAKQSCGCGKSFEA